MWTVSTSIQHVTCQCCGRTRNKNACDVTRHLVISRLTSHRPFQYINYLLLLTLRDRERSPPAPLEQMNHFVPIICPADGLDTFYRNSSNVWGSVADCWLRSPGLNLKSFICFVFPKCSNQGSNINRVPIHYCIVRFIIQKYYLMASSVFRKTITLLDILVVS